MKRGVYILWILVMLLSVTACKKKKKDSGPSVQGKWTVQVAIQNGSLPADYAAVDGQAAEFTASNYKIGTKQGTYNYTVNQNNTGGEISLSPDIYSGGESKYSVSFSGNKMIWKKNAADPDKSFTNEVTLTFTKQ
ncbi:MAG: hypothetical protein KatS3mg033_0537 [Thermonema sp.]|uniref:hypothetical protein n=1 Tax=Thermonema sp. TaxID=2231181 RepID=UPI0021DD1BA8|nr:hypothetical protein [Thermonema sp.]GIV38737.1 MAG: hypothetical protein KatS3mg033_0537 [Thermonema sp.]